MPRKRRKSPKKIKITLSQRYAAALREYRKDVFREDQTKPFPPATPTFQSLIENSLRSFWIHWATCGDEADAKALRRISPRQ